MKTLYATKKIPLILLANDDTNECMLFIDALARQQVPYTFSIAKNGEMLINLLDGQDFNPDYIFLDLHIPGFTVEECLDVFKSRKKLDQVPVIIYSKSGNPDDKDYCYNTKANEYFMKVLSFLL